MINKLKVKNFALMDELKVNFNDGFTVLTGETGAGKSILIDAISYVLGSKFNKEFIRTGEEKLEVEIEFKVDDEIKKAISSHGIKVSNNFKIYRSNEVSGKLQAKIDDNVVNVNKIKEISKYLLDIHGQHNNQNLLDPLNHIVYLDSFGDIKESSEFLTYSNKYKEYILKKEKLLELTKNNTRDKMIDFLKFQIDDIKKNNITVMEEENLINEEKMLSNSRKIALALSEAINLLDSEEIAKLNSVYKNLNTIEDVFSKVSESSKIIEESYWNLRETSTTLKALSEEIIFNDTRLDEINSRLFIYDSLKKKYGSTTREILENLTKFEDNLFELENAEEIILKLKRELNDIKGDLLELGDNLSKLRKKASILLSKEINNNLKDVGLKKADFEIVVLKGDSITESGLDEVRYIISTNTGEPKKPLEKIVSGGELSRIMLSLKSAFIDKENIPSVIFDEIDTGISGRIAEAVGEKMYRISTKAQVLCVTHLPQIASFADTNIIVEKKEVNNRTSSFIKNANSKEKVNEIAKMLSGSKITEAILNNATDLILEVNEKKLKIRGSNGV